MRITSLGHVVFAATMIALGVLCLVHADFAALWQPVPQGLPARETLVYLCAFIGIVSGIGLLWQRMAATAACALLVYLVLWLLILRLPDVFPAPLVFGAWYGCAETSVVVAAVWILYARLACDGDRRHMRFASGDQGERIARVLYASVLVFFGASHFVYLNLTTPLVPGWLPAHVFWACFFGFTYIAAGIAILVNVFARIAAALAALQMGLFTLLVWVPIVVAGHISASSWNEFVVSVTLTASAWVIADSYRNSHWHVVRKQSKRTKLETPD